MIKFCLLFNSLPDALLADLQNTVPGGHLSTVNGAANGTSGYGLLKGARRKDPQVSVWRFFDDSLARVESSRVESSRIGSRQR